MIVVPWQQKKNKFVNSILKIQRVVALFLPLKEWESTLVRKLGYAVSNSMNVSYFKETYSAADVN